VLVLLVVGGATAFVAGRRLLEQLRAYRTRRRVRSALNEGAVTAALEKLALPSSAGSVHVPPAPTLMPVGRGVSAGLAPDDDQDGSGIACVVANQAVTVDGDQPALPGGPDAAEGSPSPEREL